MTENPKLSGEELDAKLKEIRVAERRKMFHAKFIHKGALAVLEGGNLPQTQRPAVRLAEGELARINQHDLAQADEYVKVESFMVGEPMSEADLNLEWFVKVLQNWKAVFSSKDISYLWEVTHNGDKAETYVDTYRRAYLPNGDLAQIIPGESEYSGTFGETKALEVIRDLLDLEEVDAAVDCYTVWFNETREGWAALVSTDALTPGRYWRVEYHYESGSYLVESFVKEQNTCIEDAYWDNPQER